MYNYIGLAYRLYQNIINLLILHKFVLYFGDKHTHFRYLYKFFGIFGLYSGFLEMGVRGYWGIGGVFGYFLLKTDTHFYFY